MEYLVGDVKEIMSRKMFVAVCCSVVQCVAAWKGAARWRFEGEYTAGDLFLCRFRAYGTVQMPVKLPANYLGCL